MAMSGVRRNYSSLFGILTVVMYLFGFLIIGRGLSFRNVLIIVVALLMYYVANIFSIRAKKYSLRELILSVGLNFILLLFTIMLKILGIYESIVLFGIVTMFQITFRYIVNIAIVRKQKILFVGENSYTKDLLESIKNDDQYKLMGFLKDEKDETLKKIVLKMCAVGKIDIIVDFGEETYTEFPYTEWEQLSLAYAITIHKSQGSEYKNIIMTLTRPTYDGDHFLNRNILYTGITRSSKNVILMGDINTYKQASKNIRPHRLTGLAFMLKEDRLIEIL